MDGFFEFLQDYPFIAILLVYYLFRMVVGKKKPNQDAKQPGQVQQNRQRSIQASRNVSSMQQVAASADEPKSLRERIEAAMKEVESALNQAPEPKAALVQAAPTTTGSATQIEQAMEKNRQDAAAIPYDNDPFAFHSLMEKVPVRRDYDLDPNAFAPARESPIYSADPFHTQGFKPFQSEFHSAHGISHTTPAQADTTSEVQDAADQFGQMLGNSNDLQRAIILNEILGKPKSLQMRS